MTERFRNSINELIAENKDKKNTYGHIKFFFYGKQDIEMNYYCNGDPELAIMMLKQLIELLESYKDEKTPGT